MTQDDYITQVQKVVETLKGKGFTPSDWVLLPYIAQIGGSTFPLVIHSDSLVGRDNELSLLDAALLVDDIGPIGFIDTRHSSSNPRNAQIGVPIIGDPYGQEPSRVAFGYDTHFASRNIHASAAPQELVYPILEGPFNIVPVPINGYHQKPLEQILE